MELVIKYLWILIGLLLIQNRELKAQVNLVPNPSFEEFNICSGYSLPDSSESVFNGVKYWFISKKNYLSRGGEYFNACANVYTGQEAGDWGVPKNYCGYQLAKTGQGYMALHLLDYDYWNRNKKTPGIATKFTSTLFKDSIYKVSFFVSLGDYTPVANIPNNLAFSLWSTDYFGAFIGYNDHYGIDSTMIPQIMNSKNRFLDDTQGWMEVSGLYKANGGEAYITIGNFVYNTDSSNFRMERQGSNSNFDDLKVNSYYLDDISVVSVGFEASNSIMDTLICYGGSIIKSKRPDFTTCIWEDGDTSANRELNTAGKHWVTSFSGNVSVTDTFLIHWLQPETTLTDTLTCKGVSSLLTSTNALNYLWNTQETTQSINVKQAGLYWVRRFIDGCIQIDSFNIMNFPLPVISSLKDTTVCFDQVAQILLDAGQFKSYLWKPTGETTQTIYSKSAQVYLLSVTDSNNCSTNKQVAVMETCPDFVFVPNAFTPNGDGLNDVFLPQTRNLVSYEMSIVNRWGEIIFKTKNTLQGWDGKDAPADVYVVLINYKVDGKEAQSLKQNVSLLR